ncbi:hypothetical protein GCM10011501_22510 [Thalassotalea profundi]|uniref:Uncharacterized protein n=1 Tax=Thalassotalea profundi TaxID=2036687 RepID=A0ABQ3IS82_9GAMM|nr:hypothetical protein GCM10011501_22510 [Thalassotalea profundi]
MALIIAVTPKNILSKIGEINATMEANVKVKVKAMRNTENKMTAPLALNTSVFSTTKENKTRLKKIVFTMLVMST